MRGSSSTRPTDTTGTADRNGVSRSDCSTPVATNRPPTRSPSRRCRLLASNSARWATDGTTVRLASFEGRQTVVNLWATWCPPCQREMPVLQKAQAARPDVHFVFVNQGESAQQVAAYLARSGLQLRNVLLFLDTKVMGQPEVYFNSTTGFDEQGEIDASAKDFIAGFAQKFTQHVEANSNK